MPAPRGVTHAEAQLLVEYDGIDAGGRDRARMSDGSKLVTRPLLQEDIAEKAAASPEESDTLEDCQSFSWCRTTTIRVPVLYLSGEAAVPDGVLLRSDDRNIAATLTDKACKLLGQGFYQFLYGDIELRPSEPTGFQDLELQDGDHLTLIKLSLPIIVPTKGPDSDRGAFAAILPTGGVVSWGHQEGGGACPDQALFQDTTILKVAASSYAFAALTAKGRVECWGSKKGGGELDPQVKEKLQSGVSDVFSTRYAFAALKDDGSVVAWGGAREGGDLSRAQEELDGRRVKTICSTSRAFAATLEDDSVVVWGHAREGGSFWSENPTNCGDELRRRIATGGGAKTVVANRDAFAALLHDGTVATWGSVYCPDKTAALLATGTFVKVVAGQRCFVALSADGTLTPWGFPRWSLVGGPTPRNVSSEAIQLEVGNGAEREALRPPIVDILSSNHPAAGSSERLEAVPVIFQGGSLGLLQNAEADGVDANLLEEEDWTRPTTGEAPVAPKTVLGTQAGIAILWPNGDLAALGGRGQPPAELNDAKIEAVAATRQAYAALTREGKVLTWGSANYGGDTSHLTDHLHNVLYIVSTEYAFCAVRRDGAIVTWGFRNAGGDSSSVQDYFPSLDQEVDEEVDEAVDDEAVPED